MRKTREVLCPKGDPFGMHTDLQRRVWEFAIVHQQVRGKQLVQGHSTVVSTRVKPATLMGWHKTISLHCDSNITRATYL